MKKIKSLVTVIFIPLSLFAQIDGKIIDQKTKEPISYANIWVEGEKIGTTSDVEGNYSIPEKRPGETLIVSAIGYHTKKALLKEKSGPIELNPRQYEIEEIVVKPTKKKTRRIGKFRKRKIEHYYSCGAKPWIAARYYEYDAKYKKTPFLDKLDIMTHSFSDSAIFSLRILAVNDSGKPGQDILNEPIIVQPEKGEAITTVDVSNHYIKFPEEGLFVATEFYVIDQNLYEREYYSKKADKKITRTNYGPLIGNILEKDNKNAWIYVFGSWQKTKEIAYKKRKYRGKYWNLAIELTLTN